MTRSTSISITGDCYARLRAFCAPRRISLPRFLDILLADTLAGCAGELVAACAPRSVLLHVPRALADTIDALVVRGRGDESALLDAAIVRMIDELERHPGSWCRRCLEQIECCGC
ncbi:MAG TPA: hypothetical protein VFT22_07245 [Kofleriaceae bacterium]|nr:hypothetical protein [Kofleriaceae bacterium]